MKRAVFVMAIIVSVLLLSVVGCAFMNKLMPSQVDANGNPIPGTHQATPVTQSAAGLIPYGIGNIAMYGILLAWNGWEKYKSFKTGKGLTSTLQALNQVKNDPTLQADWDKIKSILADAHAVAGVQPLINQTLAKLS